MKRREFVKNSAFMISNLGLIHTAIVPVDFPNVRTKKENRKFNDSVIEETITRIKSKLKDKEVAWLFENCFPNTLDTTVNFSLNNGVFDTFVITGDIHAMWLRDSTAQVWPYLPLVNKSKELNNLMVGVINRQAKCILIDPYANAFNDGPANSEWKTDHTQMKADLHERKWEIDSLCYPVRLAYHYWKATKNVAIFDENWLKSAQLIVKTFKEQQRLENKGPYSFGRTTSWSTDTVPGNGFGNHTKPNGLIHSIFRPSDDATVFPFLIPSNLFAVQSLKQMSEIGEKVYLNSEFANSCSGLAKEIESAIQKFGIVSHPKYGKIYAMEVDGFGNHLLQDDANVPNLLSLSYLGSINQNDPIYLNTRKFVLSENNPYFFKGIAAEGIGSPHTLINQIWPMSLIMRAITSTTDSEIINQIRYLKNTHAKTGFMHESFDKDDASKFTRKWFAWANTLFGELILKLEKERPHLLNLKF